MSTLTNSSSWVLVIHGSSMIHQNNIKTNASRVYGLRYTSALYQSLNAFCLGYMRIHQNIYMAEVYISKHTECNADLETKDVPKIGSALDNGSTPPM